tara:strand:- start:1062 stop:1469 length:408 start_codon:yes stop_codon:yes gene_type:complete
MAATVSQIAAGLTARLATISGLRTFTSQPEQIQPPVGYPVLNSIEFHRAFRGGDVVSNWSLVVIVGRWTDSRAHLALDGYLSYSGASSIRAAVEADPTLGGVVSTLILATGASILPETQADAEFLMVRMDCTVHG